MSTDKKLTGNQLKFLLVMGIIVVIMCVMLQGIVNNIFHNIDDPIPIGVTATTSTITGESSVVQQLAEIDKALKNALSASIAYNVPETIKLDETVTIELLLNPSTSPEELAEQVIESGQVETSTIEVTPRMRAELIAQDDGLEVKALDDDPEQLISGTETTKWTWFVTAKEEGLHRLTLVIYRLVNVDGEDYWRKVESYREAVEVEVTLGQRIKMLDWKWIAGIVIGMLLIPAFWRWFDSKKKKTENSSTS